MNAQRLYLKLAKAIEEAPTIPTCMTTDPELFFPEVGQNYHSSRELRWALDMCKICPVRQECGEYAIAAYETHGIWGGLTPKERQQIRNRGKGRPKLAQ